MSIFLLVSLTSFSRIRRGHATPCFNRRLKPRVISNDISTTASMVPFRQTNTLISSVLFLLYFSFFSHCSSYESCLELKVEVNNTFHGKLRLTPPRRMSRLRASLVSFFHVVEFLSLLTLTTAAQEEIIIVGKGRQKNTTNRDGGR